jgi:hypothetical protein
MVGPATDCLSNPLGCIRMLFDKAVANGSPQQQLASSDWGAKDFFASELTKIGGIEKVGLFFTNSQSATHKQWSETICVWFKESLQHHGFNCVCKSILGMEFASKGGCLRLSRFTWYL